MAAKVNLITFLRCFVCLFVLGYVAGHPYKIPERNPIRDENSIWSYLSRKLVEPEALMTVPQLIQHEGYPVEIHEIKTSDGWTLEMHRIPYGRNGPNSTAKRTPVLMLPMLAFSSSVWVVNTRDQSPGFIFADAGYDVWLANFRSTSYSHKNDKHSRDTAAYWNFTLHELGTIDLPLMIDYVLKENGADQLTAVSQMFGVVPLLITLSTMPEYNNKVKLIAGLSPAISVKFGNSPAHLWYRIPHADILMDTMFEALKGQIPVKAPFIVLGSRFVTWSIPHDSLRKLLLVFFSGWDSRTTNSSRFNVVISHLADGASLKTAHHAFQIVQDGDFRMFDYGDDGNLDVYGQTEPPRYLLEKVTVPMIATYLPNELLLGKEDVVYLAERMQKSAVFRSPHIGWQHLDYFFGKESRNLYVPLINFINQHERGELVFDKLKHLYSA